MYKIYSRTQDEDGKEILLPLMEREFIGALKKPIMSAIRARLNEEKEVLITVSNKLDFADLIIKDES